MFLGLSMDASVTQNSNTGNIDNNPLAELI